MGEPVNDADAGRSQERWIFGGVRLNRDRKRTVAWIAEGSNHEMLFGYKPGRTWIVGAIYHVTVARKGDSVTAYNLGDARWAGRIDDQAQRARLELADRDAHDMLSTLALERKLKADPAIATAIAPLLTVAKTLTTAGQVRALTAYVVEEIQAARWRQK